MNITKGLYFKKFDLHVHTPASNDFTDKQATANDIVDAALAQNLTGIAITDHQTGKAIDEIKKVGNQKGLIVFPGVELKVNGGETGLHLVILFDVDKDSAHVNSFLNTIEVYEPSGGKPNEVAPKTVIDVARKLQNYDPTAILILAHCNSSQGLIGDTRGA
ncbi:MAG: PHP domain-containing protein, partial [Patescibacteria group bacterium]|nr:PHP domain-containing protein [Patescibacteria group bacterium]